MQEPSSEQRYDPKQVDLGWQPEPLKDDFPTGPDTHFVLERIEEAFLERAVPGARIAGTKGRLLDLACGQGKHALDLVAAGWDWLGLEPSPDMIERARADNVINGRPVEMLRAIGETLPFVDASFDRILCNSSLDHFANPDTGMREIARVLKPDGRAIIGVVNYHGLGCRTSRAVYAAKRAARIVPKGKRLFWDDPTAGEHTFEGSIAALKRFARGSLEMEHATGASLFWGVPGWGEVLKRLPARRILGGLDRVAHAAPGLSDFIITTWRKPR